MTGNLWPIGFEYSFFSLNWAKISKLNPEYLSKTIFISLKSILFIQKIFMFLKYRIFIQKNIHVFKIQNIHPKEIFICLKGPIDKAYSAGTFLVISLLKIK